MLKTVLISLNMPFKYALWHDGDIKWKYFRVTGPCERNPLVTGGIPLEKPVTQVFDKSLICAWTNGWANHRDADDSRSHRAYYDVIEMDT